MTTVLWARSRPVDANHEVYVRAVRTPDGETQLQVGIVFVVGDRRSIAAGVTLDAEDALWVTRMLDRGADYVETP